MRYLLVAGLLCYLGSACSSSCNKKVEKSGNESAEKIDKVDKAAALVNGKEISLSELDNLSQRALQQFIKSGRPVNEQLKSKIRLSILNKMVDDEIIKQKAESLGLIVDRFERERALEEYKERMGGPEGFEAFKNLQQLTDDQIMEKLLAERYRDKLVEKLGHNEVPSEQEIVNFYQASKQFYTVPEMVHARQLLIMVSPNDPEEKKELARKKAENAMQEAKKGGQSFAALVEKYGEGPNVKDGGDLGFFARGKMVKAFEDAAFSAPLKEAVGPIKSDYGYHIIFVEEKKALHEAPLEEVREKVVESLKRNKRARQLESVLADLRKAAEIKLLDTAVGEQENIKPAHETAKHEEK
jgi:peptidyl-prolyl cis-trans isomerase C